MNPILLEIPMPIRTPRLLIRPPQPGDGKELNAAIIESINELAPWLPFADHKPTLEESEDNVRRACAKWMLREDLRVTLHDPVTGKMIGSSGLHRINWNVPAFEIGFWVRSEFAGKGYTTEATNALTRYAFAELGARRVEIRCDPRNLASKAIIEKLGFEFEGHLRGNDVASDGSGLRDTLVYSRLNAAGLPELEVSW